MAREGETGRRKLTKTLNCVLVLGNSLSHMNVLHEIFVSNVPAVYL
jgi:hypothetical protein